MNEEVNEEKKYVVLLDNQKSNAKDELNYISEQNFSGFKIVLIETLMEKFWFPVTKNYEFEHRGKSKFKKRSFQTFKITNQRREEMVVQFTTFLVVAKY